MDFDKEEKENEWIVVRKGRKLTGQAYLEKLASDGFHAIEKRINELYNAEQKKWKLKGFGNCLKELREHFLDLGAHGIRDKGIDYIIEINEGNVEETRNALILDKIRRSFIRNLHILRNNFSNMQYFGILCASHINQLAQARNFPLEKITLLKPSQLRFDLHWFTADGAMAYVELLSTKMENRKRTSNEEVQLVTGNGVHSPLARAAIKINLEIKYEGRIGKVEGNAGILVLNFNKNI